MEKYLINKITRKMVTESDIAPEDYLGGSAEFNPNNVIYIMAEEIKTKDGYAIQDMNMNIVAELSEDEYYDGKFFIYTFDIIDEY